MNSINNTSASAFITIRGWDKNIPVRTYLSLFEVMFDGEFPLLFDSEEMAEDFGTPADVELAKSSYGDGWNILVFEDKLSCFYASSGVEVLIVLRESGGVLVRYGHCGLYSQLLREYDYIDMEICRQIMLDFETFERFQNEYTVVPTSYVQREENPLPDASYVLRWGEQRFYARNSDAK